MSASDVFLAEKMFARVFIQRLEGIDELIEPLTRCTIPIKPEGLRFEDAPGSEHGMVRNTVRQLKLKTGGWGKPSASLVLSACFVCRAKELASSGYDVWPIDESDLARILLALFEQATKDACFTLALLGSPTGWSKAAEMMAADPNHVRAFRDRRLAVVLYDTQTGEATMDETDSRLKTFWPLVAPRRHATLLAQCREAISQAVQENSSLSLASALRLCRVDSAWIRGSFKTLEETGNYKVDNLPDIGLVISRR